MAAFNTVGPQEKKTAAKLEKLRKENPEEVENLLKTVNVPSTGPPNRSQWRKLELAMKFINKSKAAADADRHGHSSPSKNSSRPGTPSRKSITSIDSKDHEKLVNRPLTKQATRASLHKTGSNEGKPAVSPVIVSAASTSTQSPRTPVTSSTTTTTTSTSTSVCQGQRSAEKSSKKVDDVDGDSVEKSNVSNQTYNNTSPRPNTTTVETNTDDANSNKKISEVQTDDNAKVLLSKKTQTDISSVKDDVQLSEKLSPRNKKKPLKKQKSLSKITNSFGKIVTLAYDFDAERS